MKTKLIWISLIVFTLASCQKEQIETEESNDNDLKKIEETYGIKFKEITQEEAQNSIFIPFDELKGFLENNDEPLSRADFGGLYSSTATWKSKQLVTLQTDNIRINFGADLRFSLTVKLSAYTSITAALKFEDVFLTYAGEKYSCFLQGSFNSPSKNEHPIEGIFDISFSTRIGGKLVSFTGQMSVKGKVPVFDKYMGAFPQSFPLVLSVTFTIR